jgi:hypothetical protein
MVGLCPFHDEHEPSLIIDAKKQLWNCLGACHEGGDVYRFVMKADGVDFREAHRRLGGHEAESQCVMVEDKQWLERAVDHYHARLLDDAASAEGAAQAVYSLRTLPSDQRLSIAATRTEPQSGKLHTEHYEVYGPVVIVLTTTSPEAFDEETRSRFVQLTMDESAAQTKAILERQRRSFTLEGVLERATAEAVQRLHHNAQRLLRPLAVVNPYVEQLTYPSDRLMHRREQKKYLALINAIALLHQHQREVKRATRGDVEIEYVEVTIEDIALANELAQDVLARGLDELAAPVRGALRGAAQAVRAACRGNEVPA